MNDVLVKEYPFEFYGINFLLYQTGQNKLVVPIKPSCERLGLSYRSELHRLKSDDILRKALVTVEAPKKKQGGKVNITCMVVEVFPYWLASLNLSKVNKRYQKKVAQYKNAVSDAWWSANISEILPDTLDLDAKDLPDSPENPFIPDPLTVDQPFPEFADPLPLNEWCCSLNWCPSQCYYHTQKDGVDYVLYLRWRWQNPWRGNIVKNAYSEKSMFDVKAEWSPDIFEQKRLYFIDEEFEQAQEKLIEIFMLSPK